MKHFHISLNRRNIFKNYFLTEDFFHIISVYRYYSRYYICDYKRLASSLFILNSFTRDMNFTIGNIQH